MPPTIVTTAVRPDLAPLIARWLWEAFWRGGGHTLAQTEQAARATAATTAPRPRTFVLLQDGHPVGTASLTDHDLDERPDLSPWLAGVYVAPHARGQGHATRLIAAVEQEAQAQGIATLWLYTLSAEGLYARAGWRTVETVHHHGQPHALMRRDLMS